MKNLKNRMLIALLIIIASSPLFPAQDLGSGVVVLKCSWEKERIRPRPSQSSLASQEELIQQSQREQQLAAARNVRDRGKVNKLETQISNHKNATAKASQTELPRDGYRYKVTLRNDGTKTIKSIDWDYLFLDSNSQNELARHQFTSDESIKPGQKKEVSVLYLVPPVKLISALALNKNGRTFAEQAMVMRIVYSDGSSWQRP